MKLNPTNSQQKFIINGDNFSDLPGFYKEISEVFMSDYDWTVATLDGFDDILYAVKSDIIWQNATKSKEDLGFDATKEFYENKIRQGKPFNIKLIEQKLTDLINGNGQTLYEILMEIIKSHPNINLILD